MKKNTTIKIENKIPELMGDVRPTRPTPAKWDLREPEGIRLFVTALMMKTDCDQDILRGLVLMIEEITNQKDTLDVVNYGDHVLRELFRESFEFDAAQEEFVEKVLIESSTTEPAARAEVAS